MCRAPKFLVAKCSSWTPMFNRHIFTIVMTQSNIGGIFWQIRLSVGMILLSVCKLVASPYSGRRTARSGTNTTNVNLMAKSCNRQWLVTSQFGQSRTSVEKVLRTYVFVECPEHLGCEFRRLNVFDRCFYHLNNGVKTLVVFFLRSHIMLAL